MSTLAEQIGDWLIEQTLGEPDIVAMFEALCRRIAGIGVPIGRVWLGWATLHPLFRAESALWEREKGVSVSQFPYNSGLDAWRKSPMAFMVESDIGVLRRRLAGPGALLDFDMTRELAACGFTDYLVFGTNFQGLEGHMTGTNEVGSGIFISYACDQPDGFRDEDIAALQALQRPLAVACKTAVGARIARNIAETYIGRRAGGNVLAGAIHLGDGEAIEAIVWYSDLRASTRLAETMPSADFIDLLNVYFEMAAGPAIRAGGEVLAFIGDAVLAIFPLGPGIDRRALAAKVFAALDEVRAASAAVDRKRAESGLEPIRFGIGLNIGEVVFGNIGVPERLAFTVVGPTVIEVARIEKLTKLVGSPVLATRDIAALAPSRWRSIGRHPLEGMREPTEIFALKSAEIAVAA